MFVPLAAWLLVALVGCMPVVVAAVGLWRLRKGQHPHPAKGAQPPVLPQPGPSRASSGKGWPFLLRGTLVLGAALLVLGLGGVWSTSPSLAWEPNPASEWSDGRAPQLEPLIRKHCIPLLAGGKTVGLAAAVVTPTNATLMTFGHPSLTSGAQTGADTLFEIGSITKTFTALALERQIEQGVVRLDEPVQELLPLGVNLPEAARGVTLGHLTTHTSGFPRLPPGMSRLTAIGMLLFGTDPYAGYNEADLLASVRKVKLQSPPGTKSLYSNFGVTLLGYLLSSKAGCSYETLVWREVCLPLGMKDTTTAPDRAQEPRVAQGYRAVLRCGPLLLALRSAPWFKGNPLSGAGGLRSTAADMLKYLQANMHPGGGPLEQALRQSHEPLFKEDERISFGMNWIRSPDKALGQTLIWHNGGTGGFCSFLGFTADGRFGVLVLANSMADMDAPALAILRDAVSRFGAGESARQPKSAPVVSRP
jgi:CubicO group peptidase (beta-lactamase class C family)